jgi:hypothetical protein
VVVGTLCVVNNTVAALLAQLTARPVLSSRHTAHRCSWRCSCAAVFAVLAAQQYRHYPLMAIGYLLHRALERYKCDCSLHAVQYQ